MAFLFATQLLEDPPADLQVAAIAGGVLGEWEAQVLQLLETREGLRSAQQWLGALLDAVAPPAYFVGTWHKADLSALRSVVFWETREMQEVTAALEYAQGDNRLEGSVPESSTEALQVLAHSPLSGPGSVGKGQT